MTTATAEKVKADWQKAQQKGGHRLSRLRTIVTQAATEAASEIKGGSSELEALSRQSLADMVAHLQTQAEAKTKEPPVTTAVEANTEIRAVVPASTQPEAAPTWAELFAQVMTLVQARKTDWGQALLTGLHSQLERFDADMTAEYGLRYRPFRPLVLGLRRLVALGLVRLTKASPATPISIEVLDQA